jgi:hypothetical protein
MSIYSTAFAVYERLASAKMNAFAAAINAHTHDGTNGVKIPFSYLDGYIGAGQIPPGLITATMIENYSITGLQIANDSITSAHIVDGTIIVNDLDTNVANSTSIKINGNGYAYYAP